MSLDQPATDAIRLFDLNPSIDRSAAASRFTRVGRVQIKDFLIEESARAILQILAWETPWGLAWQAGKDGPHGLRRQEVAALTPADKHLVNEKITAGMRGRAYAFTYAQYRIVDAYLERWSEHQGLDYLLEHINSDSMVDLVRGVTGIPELKKADAQATLFGPMHFLGMHDDSHVADASGIAYVMNFCGEDWRPDWGGYLLFYDEDGDVVAGFRPRFNALNLFRVPQKHSVSYVPPFAPVARFAITGWFRDR
jgi:Rps23 Pro-64 3,4-dihydroxylase Tpa1-like proline 4-hydroxylase